MILNLNIPALLPVETIAKIVILILILLYLIFTVVAFVNIRALDRLVTVNVAHASKFVQFLYRMYLFIAIVLFVVALVIL